jgi:ATP-grasp domain
VQSRIAIATTTWWPLAARLGAAFSTLGANVGAICPAGSPVAAVSGVREIFRYSALAPLRSLTTALLAMEPDLIVPCDERAVGHLHELYAQPSTEDSLRRLIERSLGFPAGYAIALGRGASLEAAAREGIAEPSSRALRSVADVRTWCGQRKLPAVLKADGTWGGAGVEVVNTAEAAEAAFRRMSRPVATWRVAKFLLSNRDPFPLRGWLRRERAAVIGQDFVKGRSANIMAACWEGEVLATVGAVALETAKQFGAATIIQPIAHDEMEQAAKRLVRRLGISGFCGLDFVIEDGTGKAWMIELNPRATQLGHLAIGPTGSLAATLLARLRGERLPVFAQPHEFNQRINERSVAFFPQALLADTGSSLLPSAYHDVPWEEPDLVAELLRRPWDSRSPLARMTDRLMRRPDPERILATSFAHMRPPEPSIRPAAEFSPSDIDARMEAAEPSAIGQSVPDNAA